jgi:lysozyme
MTPARAAALFQVIREIKGSGLTQAEVDRINRALMSDVATAAKSGRRASKAGIDLIHSFESLRLSTYKDPGSANGLPITGGWGTTRDENGKPFQLGRTEPKEYWDRLFERDLAAFENGVNLLLGSAPTTQAQFDALVSFAYNVGLDIDDDDKAEGLGDSTLLKKHLRGDYAGAAAEFHKWNKNDGQVLNGLVRRRKAEAALYSS